MCKRLLTFFVVVFKFLAGSFATLGFAVGVFDSGVLTGSCFDRSLADCLKGIA